MSVDDVLQVDATVDSLLQLRKHPARRISICYTCFALANTHSEGLAGSIMTASLVLSSVTTSWSQRFRPLFGIIRGSSHGRRSCCQCPPLTVS